MRYLPIICFFILITIIGCKESRSNHHERPTTKDTISPIKDSLPNSFDVMEELTSQFENKVKLDTFLTYLTRQNNVRLITHINENYDDEKNALIYSAPDYYFELRIDTTQATTFKEGKKSIRFSDHSILCDPDTVFDCIDYGFNVRNSLHEPKIIEVAGHRFLYSSVSYMCNGIGCGCNIIMIYDLETKKPTFIENYRLGNEGFFLSDFDNDNNPDLLLMSNYQGERVQKKGLGFDVVNVKLSWYYYDDGKFKPKKNKASGKPNSYELYSFIPYYDHSWHGELVYSITKDNWKK